MKFTGKMSKLLAGGIGFTVILSTLSIDIQPQIATTAVAQVAQGLSPEEINLRAKQIVVRIDGASVGSGSLIKHSDDVYTVLTNWHVMENQGEYTVSTIDGRKHQVDPASIQQLSGIDLAIFTFTSNQNYQVAELGNSDNLNEGQNVYFAGYPGELRREDNRYYRFFSANLVGILPKSNENGYSLVYNGEAFPGMSGSPVFNREGLVIGVHGEANVHALSGGTSNYAIPIDTYKSAIANLNQQPPTENTPAQTEAASSPTNDVETQPEAEATPPPENSSNPDNISSVPTFVPDPPAEKPTPEPQNQPETANETEAEKSEADEPEATDSAIASEAETEAETAQSTNEPPVEPEPEPEVESETIEVSTVTRDIPLVSKKTGINYTPLRDLLKEEKWSEADLQTYELVEQIIQTAKQKNKHFFIELKTIAEFSCPDIRTIDSLWKKYTGNKFGFSSQQEVWQSVNQEGDFSTKTWRRFATEVGWKEGEVASPSGYLLYDELDFDPNQAPVGHLPWWFALSDEEQKVIKHLFARCNFDPSPQELAAEEGSKPQKPRENNANNRDEQPNVEKTPKSID